MSSHSAKNDVLWTEAEAAVATRSTARCSFAATGVSIDSRSVVAGDLFIALKGPNFDGHTFVAKAFAAGAVAPILNEVPADVAEHTALQPYYDIINARLVIGRDALALSAT